MVIEIKDRGPGIPPEYLERIFDPFFSLKEKGSGLGLSIAANIMQAHAGTIKVCNNTEQGTCFQLIFPPAEPVEDGLRVARSGFDQSRRGTGHEAYSCG